MHRSNLFVLCLLLGLAGPVWADGNMRPATPAERAFSQRMLTAASQALPQPPAGYEARDPTPVAPVERVPAADKAAPMQIFYTVSWFNPEEAAKERAQEKEAIARAAAQYDDPRQKSLEAKQKQLSAAFSQALQKNNQGKMKKVQKDLSQVGRELSQLVQTRNAAIRKEARIVSKLSRLMVRVNVNDFATDLPANALKEHEPIAGNLAFAYHDPDGKFEDRLTVLVGTWQMLGQQERIVYRSTAKTSVPATQAQTIVVSAIGNMDLARKALAGVDWKALGALLK